MEDNHGGQLGINLAERGTDGNVWEGDTGRGEGGSVLEECGTTVPVVRNLSGGRFPARSTKNLVLTDR